MSVSKPFIFALICDIIGATGARDLSQAVKELWALPVGSRGIVSICADGGQGTVALLERV